MQYYSNLRRPAAFADTHDLVVHGGHWGISSLLCNQHWWHPSIDARLDQLHTISTEPCLGLMIAVNIQNYTRYYPLIIIFVALTVFSPDGHLFQVTSKDASYPS